MIKTLKEIFRFLFLTIDWSELLNGILLILVGLAFNRNYGYRVLWPDLAKLSLWYISMKSGIFCLEVILSGKLLLNFQKSPGLKISDRDFRTLLVSYFWIIAILLLAISFLPLIEFITSGRLNHLSLLTISLIYFLEFVCLMQELERFLAGLNEVVYAFTTAFLLPVLCISLSMNGLKSTFILLSFPLFLELIAWKIVNHLNFEITGEHVPSNSLIKRVGNPDSLYVSATLIVLGSLALFLENQLIYFIGKIAILPIALGAAWLIYRSVRVQNPNWVRALLLTRLLPIATGLLMVVSLWLI